MRHALFLLLAAAFLSLPFATRAQAANSSRTTESWARFDHRLRTESPRWPDGRYYEKYTFSAAAGDQVMVGLAGEQSGNTPPGPHQHLSLIVDRGDGLESLKAEADGFHAEFRSEQATNYSFYVFSRQPDQTGPYTLVIAVGTSKRPPPVYYHMIFDSIVAAGYKNTRSLDVRRAGPPIRVRVDATGFKPVLTTFRLDPGGFAQVSYPHEFKEGPRFASSIMDTLGDTTWRVEVTNNSQQPGTCRLVLEYPKLLTTN